MARGAGLNDSLRLLCIFAKDARTADRAPFLILCLHANKRAMQPPHTMMR